MGSLQPVKRIYKGPDTKMKDDSEGIYSCFLEDEDKFIEFDPDFGPPFGDNYHNIIITAEDIQKKSAVDANLKALTTIVEDKMELCRNKFQSTKYFIEKAFKNNNNVWQEFGYKDYLAARKNQILMKEFMRNFYKTATKYSAKLIEAKYTAEKIEEINTLLLELVQADSDQEDFKRGRPTLTQDNIEKLNVCNAMTAKVANVGKQIFANDYAKHKRYVLTIEPETTETPAAPEAPTNPVP